MSAVARRLARDESAPEDARDVAALEQGQVERQARDARREADDQVAALPRDRAQRGLGVIAADRVIDEVRAIRADGFLELARQRLRRILVERLAAIDDDLVGARSPPDRTRRASWRVRGGQYV